MSKITLNPLASLTNQTTAINLINSNSTTTQNAFDNTLSRDGTQPNAMGASIDMNSNHIINLPAPGSASEPARLQDVTSTNPINISLTLAGDVTSPTSSSTLTTTIAPGAVTSAKIAAGANILGTQLSAAANILGSQLSASANLNPSQIANQPAFTYLGNNTSGTAAVTAVTAANLVSTVNPWISAGGTADAITATYSPAITSLTDGLQLSFRASAANTTSAPTFSPNGLTARAITRLGGSTLSAGDIAGNNYEVKLRYNLSNTRWEIINPAWSLHSSVYLGAYAVNVNANSVADTTMNVRVPPSGNYTIERIVIQNLGTTASLTTAQFGIFTGAGGTGTTISAASALTTLTSNAVNTTGSATSLSPGNLSNFWLNLSSFFFRITAAQGAAATINVYIYIRELPQT